MQKLISELTRLYVPGGPAASPLLAQRLLGQKTAAIDLCADDGRTRALLIPFPKLAEDGEAQHWSRLCEVANALQSRLGLPAPAVSISGADGYGLWLSLEVPVPVAQAQQFLELLQQAYCPEVYLSPDAARAPAELPPCLHQGSGKWAAFIHPGMGASFADESGLDMAPPFGGQAAFLEGLQCISEAQFQHALAKLRLSDGAATVTGGTQVADGLLLKDATLEDIVRHLHAKNIEPTFRHRIPR